MKKYIILFIICIVFLVGYLIIKKMQNNSQTPSKDGSVYNGKTGEVISYIDHPVISINDVTIKYIGTREQPKIEGFVQLGAINSFVVSATSGKNFQIDWTSGTGELPGPSTFTTTEGCYSLNINIIEGKKLYEGVGSISGRLVLYKNFFGGKCDNEWTKDLR